MNRGSTHFLRAVIIGIGVLVLGICIFGLPAIISSDNTGMYRPIFLGLYVPAIPFFIALHQAFKLLGLIDHDKAFSTPAVQILKYIKYCALSISGLFVLGMPYIFAVADKDDAPGVAAIGFIIIGASFVIATFAAVLQRLIQNAVDIQAENDLTV